MLWCRLTKPRRVLAGLLTGLFIINLLGACSLQDWDLDPDTIEEDISLERAQSLTPYTLCFPSWLPPGVEAVPLLVYHDAREGPGGPRMAVNIKAEYAGTDGDTVLELQQSGGDERPNSSRLRYKYSSRELLDWLLEWRVHGDWDKVRAIEAGLVWTGSTYQEGDLTYDAVEISVPDEWRASLVKWYRGDVAGDVENTLFSLLPLTVTLDVARSMSGCGE